MYTDSSEVLHPSQTKFERFKKSVLFDPNWDAGFEKYPDNIISTPHLTGLVLPTLDLDGIPIPNSPGYIFRVANDGKKSPESELREFMHLAESRLTELKSSSSVIFTANPIICRALKLFGYQADEAQTTAVFLNQEQIRPDNITNLHSSDPIRDSLHRIGPTWVYLADNVDQTLARSYVSQHLPNTTGMGIFLPPDQTKLTDFVAKEWQLDGGTPSDPMLYSKLTKSI